MKTIYLILLAGSISGQQVYAADTAVTDASTAQETIESFEKTFGVTPSKRRNHTKGFCFVGMLAPTDEDISQYSTSRLFTGQSKVVGRLSHKGGNNDAPDDQAAQYGMGLALTTQSGDRQLMAMNTEDFFPVATPEEFAELMRAKATGSDAVKTFKARNSDLRRHSVHHAAKSKTLVPYEGSIYNSINSFYLVNSAGHKTAVRWSFVPAEDQGIVLEPKHSFFFDNMQTNLLSSKIVWDMVITLANPDDLVNNPAVPWTGEHKQIRAATLTVSSISTEQDGQCNNINFDPMVSAPGIEPSEDPMLNARRNAYAISFGKRLLEQQQ